MAMKNIFKAALLAGAMGAASVLGVAPAAARDSVSVGVDFDEGLVAFAYSDGYWDSDHHWHNWRNKSDWDAYRAHHPDRSFNHRHDRDPNKGWRS
jgi:hypothetical protein